MTFSSKLLTQLQKGVRTAQQNHTKQITRALSTTIRNSNSHSISNNNILNKKGSNIRHLSSTVTPRSTTGIYVIAMCCFMVMYVCMFVYMCVRMYGCICVCVYVCTRV